MALGYKDKVSLGSPIQEIAPDHLSMMYEDLLKTIGISGREIARLSGTRPQYISDIKRRHRSLSSNMFMRTLNGLFGRYQWLITGDLMVDTKHIIALYPSISETDGELYTLPVLSQPFVGPRMRVEGWDGSFIRVSSKAAVMAKSLVKPYVLDLPFDEYGGRFRKGDYLLVEQSDRAHAKFQLIKCGWGIKLVQRGEDAFIDAGMGKGAYPLDSEVAGSVVMLLYATL